MPTFIQPRFQFRAGGVGTALRQVVHCDATGHLLAVTTPRSTSRSLSGWTSSPSIDHYLHNADLFRAVRGGGGNFGVAAPFEFRFHPVGLVITGGLVCHQFSALRASVCRAASVTAAG